MGRGVAAGVLVVGGLGLVGLGACGGDDGSDEERLADRLEEEFEVPGAVADCVAREVYARFSEDEIATLSEAGSADDLPEDLLRRVRAVLTPCAGAGG